MKLRDTSNRKGVQEKERNPIAVGEGEGGGSWSFFLSYPALTSYCPAFGLVATVARTMSVASLKVCFNYTWITALEPQVKIIVRKRYNIKSSSRNVATVLPNRARDHVREIEQKHRPRFHNLILRST